MTLSERRFVAGVCFSLAVLGLASACVSPTDHPPPAEDPHPPVADSAPSVIDAEADADAGDAEAGAGDGGVTCITGTQQAGIVQQQIVAGSPPLPTGGTLVPGTYLLTTMNYYGGTPGPSGVQAQLTLTITGNEFVIVGVRTAAKTITPADAIASMTQRVTQMGTSLFFSLVCPLTAAFPSELEYSIAGGNLTLYKNGMDLEIYVKK